MLPVAILFMNALWLLAAQQSESSGLSAGKLILIIIGVIVGGLILLGIILGYFFNYKKMLERADAALARGDTEKAQQILEKIVENDKSETFANQSAEVIASMKESFGAAHMKLAELLEDSGKKPKAFEHYKRGVAYGKSPTKRAVLLMAEHYAFTNTSTSEAIDIYVRFIRLRPREESTAKVYSALEAACKIDESKKPKERKKSVELNQRVVEANPQLDWAHYNLGLASFLDGNVSEASGHFSRALKLNPNHAMTYYWVGACHLRAAKPDTEAAVTAVRKFLSYTSEKSSFLKRQGRAAFELGKHLIENMGGFDADRTKLTDSQKEIVQQAIGYLRTATEKEQSSGEYHLYLGRALALSGHTDAAIASLQAATEREDKKPEYLFHLASECSRAGRLAEAIDALKRAVTIKPDDVDTRDLLAKTCLRAGDYEELERQARKLLKLRGKAPADVALLLRALYHQGRHAVVIKEIESRPEGTISPEISAEAVFAVAHSYLHTGDAEKAVAWFEGIAKDPRWLYPFACALAHLGRIDEAQIRLTELLTAPGEWAAKGQNLRANLCLRQNLLPAAEEAGRAGVSLAPEDLEAHYTLGCVLYRKGEFEKAREEFEFVVERQPNHARAHLALGMIAEQARENAEAIEHYECIAESDAEAPIARLRLGIMACRQHDYARAYPLLHGLEGPEADSDAHLFYLATAQLFCGRTDEAIHMWEKLRSRHPGDQELLANIVRARYLYGSHLAREEKHVQAIAEWDEYLKVFPQDTKVVKDHAKLCFRAAWQAIRSGALVEAETLLRRAVDGDAEESAYSFHLALCEMRLGRANDALPRLNALKKDAVYGPRAGYHIGICLLQLNRASDAVTELERALRNAPAPYAQCAAWAMANEKLRHEKVRDAMDMLTACL